MSMNAQNVAAAGMLVAVSFLTGCGLGGKTTTLTLQTQVASISAGQQQVFTAFIIHNNQQFLGATWTLTSGGSACMPACGTLGNSTNSGSSGNGDTATITYTAPKSYANQVTITAASVENPSSTGSDTFTIAAAPLAVQPVTFGADGVGVAYLPQTLQAIGGTSPYIWSVATGSLPAGMELSSVGVISGTPTAEGVFSFGVQVQDSVGMTATASETLTVIGSPNVSITGVTVHSGSTDPQFATITTSDGSRADIWGDKDSNGIATSLRSLKVTSPDGTSGAFSFDSTGHLVRFGPSTGTVFTLNWQSDTSATLVAYSAGGTAVVGPTQITIPSPAAATAAIKRNSHTLATLAAPSQNDFQVQVTHCGKPAQNAAVSLDVAGAITPNELDIVLAEQTAPGTYDAQIPVLIPGSVIASTVALCDNAANALQTVSNAKNVIGIVCMGFTAAAVVASDGAGALAAAEIDTACVQSLGLFYEVNAVLSIVSPSTTSLFRMFCDTGIPAVANLINDSTVIVSVTATIPGQPAKIGSFTAYGGQGSFPGSGLAPLLINFDTGGACDIKGNWKGGWSRVDEQGEDHAGGLEAAIADSSATPGTYDVALTVTDSHGSAGYNFSGEPTDENQLGTFFGFGPAAIDGVTGTAQGVLTPDGKALSGSFSGAAPGASGGWSMIKQ